MSTPSLCRRLALAAGVTAASIAPSTAPVVASGDDGDSAVVIESTGDPATAIVLPPVAIVGQAASSSATIDFSIAAGGRQVELAAEMDLSASVIEVGADGRYVTELTIERLELTTAPAEVDPATLGYDDLAGVQFQQTFEPGGRLLSTELLNAEELSAAARASAEGFTSNLQTAQFVYPTEAVGIGAAWTAELQLATDGFAIPTSYRFEVTDIAGGRYTLAIGYQSAFDTTVDGTATTGTVSGLGTASASLDNPLDVLVDLGQTINASTRDADLTVTLGLTITSLSTGPGG